MDNEKKANCGGDYEQDLPELARALMGIPDQEALIELIPELRPLAECSQDHPGHCLDVLAHTIKVVEALPDDLILRLAGLLHDIAKPECKLVGIDGYEHFWGHEEAGAQKARPILQRLGVADPDGEIICELIRRHDTPVARSYDEMRQAVARDGADFVGRLLWLQHCDLRAHSPDYCTRKMKLWEEIYGFYREDTRGRDTINIYERGTNENDQAD